MQQIPVRRHGDVVAYAQVDDEVYEALSRWRWALDPQGYATCSTHRIGRVKMHRLVLGLQAGDPLVADHINGDRLDNRRSNLRALQRGDNLQNLRPRRGTRGVDYDPSRPGQPWRARAQLRGRRHHIGRFATEAEAATAAAAWYAEHMPLSNPERHHVAP